MAEATTVQFRINLSSETADKFDRASSQTKIDPEILMAEILEHVPVQTRQAKPITLDDNQRQQLEKILNRNLNNADDLIRHVGNSLRVKVEDTEIPLSPYLLDRLKSRAINLDFNTFLRQTIKRLLEEYAGLR